MRRALGLAVLLTSSSSLAEPASVRFAFEDERYLLAGQREGGAAYVPSSVSRDEPVPLVIFLHGVNAYGQMHLWMDGPLDLRPLAERLSSANAPFVLAAPSQTRDARSGTSMWPDLDIDAFARATQAAIASAATVDLDRVYVVGHSGAGCNPRGGLARAAESRARATMAIDICMDEDIGAALSPVTRLWVTWQAKTWPRDLDGFKRGLGDAGLRVRIDLLDLDSPNPHDDIVPLALSSAIRQWM